MTVPLWSQDNHTIYSDVFTVAAGKVCVLFAVGLLDERVKTRNTEFNAPQAVCVRRLLYAPDLVFGKSATCDWVAVSTSASKIADARVSVSKGCWLLTPNNNLGIIGVPGVYRLELNDATAVNEAQVYAELYDAAAVPLPAGALFFG